VPVLSVKRESTVAGGAANVALNVAGLHAKTIVAGAVGNDASGKRLLELLDQSAVDVRSIVVERSRPTTCKTRIISGNHQIVRLDEEVTEDLPKASEELLTAQVLSVIRSGVNAVILSDYAKGVLSASFVGTIIRECRQVGIAVLVDPKQSDYSRYSGATCVTPNQKEFRAAVAAMSTPAREVPVDGAMLRHRLDCTALLVTQGGDGMTLVTSENWHHLPALAEEVFDVSGAGDTVIATLGTAVGAGLPLLAAVQLSNAAASIVVRRFGTTPIVWQDLWALVSTELKPGLFVTSQTNESADKALSAALLS
jgi:D-beta-D-heptose 7-phosphate kinase/D-beta-D-heptose 1-phosphate adenosyltransferase